MAAPAKIDWFQVRKDYIQDASVSYNDLAIKYGVSQRSVQERGTSEGWPELRKSLAEKAFAAFQNKLLGIKSKAQDRHLLNWQNLQALANRRIQEIAEDKKMAIDAKELKDLTATMKMAIDGERVVLGLPTTVGALTDPDGRPLVPVAVFDLKPKETPNDEQTPPDNQS